jgi:hypothetical protein
MDDKFCTKGTGVQSLPISCEVQYRIQQYFISGTVSYPSECSHLRMKNIPYYIYNCLLGDEGTAVAQWLRYCATNQKVAGSIPGCVIGVFHLHNPSDRTMALGSTQPLTEMSTRCISWG